MFILNKACEICNMYKKSRNIKIVFVCLGGFLCNIQPSQHAVIGLRTDISGWQAAVFGTRLPITACFPGADAALALAGGDLSVLGPTEARALISDACCTPMFYYLY